ncbi:outer membrane protein transport protein [Telmatospirillum sp.]|uniref:OmpP1/FadL family transporter n=1 Tax=Telmatospirillum sp. TaxID=2079197 RepID=UPI00284C985E|nr:outer membrane protein transport protein [Telmatospirillum sp.]MDR3436133.1 outer membrane protein transport protein [Telmatospirillum sp.]
MSLSTRNATLVSCLGLAVVCGLAGQARAAGFALREQSAEGLGDAFAGQTAKAYNASTVFYNPAGMTNLTGSEVAGTTTWIAPESTFKGSNSNVIGGNVAGRDNVNAIKAAAIGSVFGVWDASPDWKFGVAVATPFGMRSDYKVNWVGRYQALASDVTDVDFSVVGAYRINDHLSIGGGPRFDYLKARLSQAINFNAVGLQAAQQYATGARQAAAAATQLQAAATQAAAAGQAATAAAYAAQATSYAAQAQTLASDAQTTASWGDGLGKVEGDDYGVGYNLGVLYEFNKNTRVGLDYRSRSAHTLSGTVNNQTPASLSLAGAATAGLFINQNATAKITLPDSLNLGFYHDINSRWAILSDIQWTHWGLFKQLNVIGANGQAISSTNENWQDTWFASLGAHYKIDSQWMVHGGVAYDLSPIKNDQYRTARIPDSNRYWLSAGASYVISPATELHLGYTHIFADKANIKETANSLAGVLNGSYSNSVDIVSSSFVLRF